MVYCMKMPKSQLINISFFYFCGDVYKFTRDHATLKFHKLSRVFYVMSTYYKTTTDYIKYSSIMAKNRVCEIFNSVLKNKLNRDATEQSEKAILFGKATIKFISLNVVLVVVLTWAFAKEPASLNHAFQVRSQSILKA